MGVELSSVESVSLRQTSVLEVYLNLIGVNICKEGKIEYSNFCHTLLVIFESTSLQQRQAIRPTIPKAIDTIATTLNLR